jgi:hypothetical protein
MTRMKPHFKEIEMQNRNSAMVVDLETKFWQSLVDRDTDAALALLCEPALMVSAHGAMSSTTPVTARWPNKVPWS